MNPELRGAYKDFLESEVGKDFFQYIVSMEISYQAQGFRASTTDEKASCMDKLALLYKIRSALNDISKPVVVSKSAGDSQVRSAAGPQVKS